MRCVCTKINKKNTFFQQIAFKNLVERNKEREKREGPPPPNSAIQLPFIIVNTSKKTVIDCRYVIFYWSDNIWIDLVSRLIDWFNTSYLIDSYIIFTLKMESVSKNTIFDLKMMVKIGLEKIFLKFLHAGDYFSLLHKSVQNHKFSNKNNHHPAWRDFKINFCWPLFTIIFRPKIVFLDTDSILRVKTMYESVK